MSRDSIAAILLSWRIIMDVLKDKKFWGAQVLNVISVIRNIVRWFAVMYTSLIFITLVVSLTYMGSDDLYTRVAEVAFLFTIMSGFILIVVLGFIAFNLSDATNDYSKISGLTNVLLLVSAISVASVMMPFVINTDGYKVFINAASVGALFFVLRMVEYLYIRYILQPEVTLDVTTVTTKTHRIPFSWVPYYQVEETLTERDVDWSGEIEVPELILVGGPLDENVNDIVYPSQNPVDYNSWGDGDTKDNVIVYPSQGPADYDAWGDGSSEIVYPSKNPEDYDYWGNLDKVDHASDDVIHLPMDE